MCRTLAEDTPVRHSSDRVTQQTVTACCSVIDCRLILVDHANDIVYGMLSMHESVGLVTNDWLLQ